MLVPFGPPRKVLRNLLEFAKFLILEPKMLRLALRLVKMGVIPLIFTLFPHPRVLEKSATCRIPWGTEHVSVSQE